MHETLVNNLRESGWSDDGIALILEHIHEPRMHNTFKRFHGEPVRRAPNKPKVRIPAGLRKRVFERDAYRCILCGTWRDLTLDHFYPESLGGETSFENLRTLCRSCNSKKGARV